MVGFYQYIFLILKYFEINPNVNEDYLQQVFHHLFYRN